MTLDQCICCVRNKKYGKNTQAELGELLDCILKYGRGVVCETTTTGPTSGGPTEYEFILGSEGTKSISLPGFLEIIEDPSKYEVFIDGRKVYYNQGQFTYLTGVFSSTAGELASGSFVSITIR